jgi:uncharacterized protein
MKALGLFILLLGVCLTAAALTAPWVLGLPAFAQLGGLHRLISPLAKLWALPLTCLLLWYLALCSRQALGLKPSRGGFLREFGRGWLWGVASFLPLALLLLWSGAITFERFTPRLWSGLVEAVLLGLFGGLLIGLVEEIFFRGAVYGAMRQESGWRIAALGSAFYYAALHFIDPPPLALGATVDWASGLVLLADGFQGLAGTEHLDSLTALVLVGLLLALIRERRGDLALCIGLHAGWVFGIRVLRKLTRVDRQDPNAFLVGAYDGVIGWLAAGYVALLILLFLIWPRAWPKAWPWLTALRRSWKTPAPRHVP